MSGYVAKGRDVEGTMSEPRLSIHVWGAVERIKDIYLGKGTHIPKGGV